MIARCSRIFMTAAAVCAVVLSVSGGRPVAASHAASVIYDDRLAPGWSDWSWNTTIDWQDATNPHSGKDDVAFTFDHAWDGLSVHADTPVDTSPYDLVRFWINGGAAGGQKLWLYVEYPGGGSSPPVDLTPYIAGNAIVPAPGRRWTYRFRRWAPSRRRSAGWTSSTTPPPHNPPCTSTTSRSTTTARSRRHRRQSKSWSPSMEARAGMRSVPSSMASPPRGPRT